MDDLEERIRKLRGQHKAFHVEFPLKNCRTCDALAIIEELEERNDRLRQEQGGLVI